MKQVLDNSLAHGLARHAERKLLARVELHVANYRGGMPQRFGAKTRFLRESLGRMGGVHVRTLMDTKRFLVDAWLMPVDQLEAAESGAGFLVLLLDCRRSYASNLHATQFGLTQHAHARVLQAGLTLGHVARVFNHYLATFTSARGGLEFPVPQYHANDEALWCFRSYLITTVIAVGVLDDDKRHLHARILERGGWQCDSH
jgi:hypothetical protein